MDDNMDNNLFVQWFYNIMMQTRPDALIRSPEDKGRGLTFIYRKGIDLCMVIGSDKQSGVILLYTDNSQPYEINEELLHSYQTNIKLLKACGGIDSNKKLLQVIG